MLFRVVLIVSLILPATGSGDSLSRGNPTQGRLEQGVELPTLGSGHAFLPATIQRGYRFGTQELIAGIRQAVQSLTRTYPSAILRLGNLSKMGGGNIPQSRSHNSGRDADFAFFLMDNTGQDCPQETLLELDAQGRTPDGKCRFDVERNWKLVEALIDNKHFIANWIFVAQPLREALLMRAASEPTEMQLKATALLRQPSDSAPHDDHFHLRIYCAKNDWPLCEESSALWPWAPARPPEPAEPSPPIAPMHDRVAQLIDAPKRTRLQRRQLRRWTNHAFATQEEWRQWWVHAATQPQTQWIEDGFSTPAHRKLRQGTWGKRIHSLIQAISGPDWISYNARRELREMTGNTVGTWDWKARKARRYWTKWWKKNRIRYGPP